MKDTDNDASRSSDVGLHGQKPTLQVICLGASGGPCEENVTGFLVRSTESDWARGSLLAVDAGSHLAPIVRILERDFPRISDAGGRANGNEVAAPTLELGNDVAGRSLSPSPSIDEPVPAKPEPTLLTTGPFAGLKLPNASARANAMHVLRSYISTYLITHPHLDHLSGFTVNTAAFHATSKPKTLAALPSTVDAIKKHIFNDVIWPNLSDEDGGVGFVTFQRLKEGGDVMVGEGEGRGYIDVVDGLGVRAFQVSHGVCTKSPPSHHHRGSNSGLSEPQQQHSSDPTQPVARTVSTSQHNQYSTPGTPGVTPRTSFYANNPSPRLSALDGGGSCVVDSTAYFIRDTETQREILVFGDIEPDSISLSPRNRLVWQEAARKIAHHLLGGIFIECSYDDSQADAFLFGHLSPRHVVAELQCLAGLVVDAKAQRALERSHGVRKRKRSGPNGIETVAQHALLSDLDRKRGRATAQGSRRGSAPDTATTSPSRDDRHDPTDSHRGSMSPRSITLPAVHLADVTSSSLHSRAEPLPLPLTGIRVVIIHIKDTMKDGPHVSEDILAQLREHEDRLREEGRGLGCEFVISQSGESYWF